ncbi:MAG: alpha/beta hydrolase family protein [Planctomycetota bacterium]
MASAADTSRLLAAEGRGYLEEADDQLILHVAGTPYEMGWQHGRLLREAVRSRVHRAAAQGVRFRRQRQAWRRLRGDLPACLVAEAAGLADGAGVARDALGALQLLNVPGPLATASCTVAAWGGATQGDEAFHAKRLPDRAGPGAARVLVAAEPSRGLAHVYAAPPGSVGGLAAMNVAGVAISAELNLSGDRDGEGMPAGLQVRQAVRRCHAAREARALLMRHARSHSGSFVVSDPAGAAVVEAPGGRPERRHEPRLPDPARLHPTVPDTLCRVARLAAGLSAGMDQPGRSGPTWLTPDFTYWSASEQLVRYRGRLGPHRLASILSDGVPSGWGIVFAPAGRRLWLAQPGTTAGDGSIPARALPLRLADLLAHRRVPAAPSELPRRPPARAGTCRCDDTLLRLHDPDPEVARLLQAYNVPPEPFPWRLRRLQQAEKYSVHHLTFPSPIRYDLLECNTVHAEYYQPRQATAPGPGLIVLHILDGRFLVARMVCRSFAAMGVPCLMVQMPYYGARRPRGVRLSEVMLEKPQRMFEAMEGAVPDIRRAASWLQARPEVDPDRLGLLGVSLGAITGALVAGVDPRFNRNVLVIGGGDPATILWHAPETRAVRRHLEQMGYTRESLAEAVQAVDPITFAHRVNPRQALMINATDDQTIPKACTLALWEAMGKPTLQWRRGGHYSMGLYTPLILSDAHTFITRLPPDPSWREP